MDRFFMSARLLAASLLALALTACIPTAEHPIAGKTGGNDQGLIGAWQGTTHDGVPVWLHFLRGKEEDKSGELGVLLIPQGKDPKEADEWSSFRAVTAEVKGTHYMSALWDYNDGKPTEAREKGYHLVRYERGPDGALALWLVDEEKLIAAVEAGKVEGKIEGEGVNKEVRVTASSEKLAKFLAKIDPKDLFNQPFITAKLVH
jgi:hypothetical protein